MSQYRIPESTPVSMEQVYASFRRARPTLSPEGLLVLTAHVALETGDGKHVRNFNLGGAKASVEGSRDWTFFGTHEVIKGVSTFFSAPSLARQPLITHRDATREERTTCFRAYPSLDAATVDHADLIEGTFSSAWPLVESGQAYDYGHRLGALRYYTADRDKYAAAVASNYARLGKQVAGWKADA